MVIIWPLPVVGFVKVRLHIIIWKLSLLSVIAVMHRCLPVVVRQAPAVRSTSVVETDRRPCTVFGHLMCGRPLPTSAARDAGDNNNYDDDEQKCMSDRETDDQCNVVV